MGGWWVVCGQTLRQVVAQLELELLQPCQYNDIVSSYWLHMFFPCSGSEWTKRFIRIFSENIKQYQSFKIFSSSSTQLYTVLKVLLFHHAWDKSSLCHISCSIPLYSLNWLARSTKINWRRCRPLCWHRLRFQCVTACCCLITERQKAASLPKYPFSSVRSSGHRALYKSVTGVGA